MAWEWPEETLASLLVLVPSELWQILRSRRLWLHRLLTCETRPAGYDGSAWRVSFICQPSCLWLFIRPRLCCSLFRPELCAFTWGPPTLTTLVFAEITSSWCLKLHDQFRLWNSCCCRLKCLRSSVSQPVETHTSLPCFNLDACSLLRTEAAEDPGRQQCLGLR